MPQTVWYQFPRQIVVAKFGFSSRDRCCLNQSPLEFQLIGSNDGKHWKIIQSYTTKFTALRQAKEWVIPTGSRSAFLFYGIRTLRTASGVYTAIKHMKMWTTTPSKYPSKISYVHNKINTYFILEQKYTETIIAEGKIHPTKSWRNMRDLPGFYQVYQRHHLLSK